VVHWAGSEHLTHCHQWIVLRTKSVHCNMKIQRRNIKYWIDLRVDSVLDITTEYVDQKQMKSRWTWKTPTVKVFSHEAGPGVLWLIGIQSESRPVYSLDYTCWHQTGLLLAMICGLEVVYMWCELICQTIISSMTRRDLFLQTLLCWPLTT